MNGNPGLFQAVDSIPVTLTSDFSCPLTGGAIPFVPFLVDVPSNATGGYLKVITWDGHTRELYFTEGQVKNVLLRTILTEAPAGGAKPTVVFALV